MSKRMTEERMQNWRAIGVSATGGEHLLYVGNSYEQVKRHYPSPYFSHLTEDERVSIKKIHLQKWSGIADSGKWVSQESLRLPNARDRVTFEKEPTDVAL
jgi:hypothetical protein